MDLFTTYIKAPGAYMKVRPAYAIRKKSVCGSLHTCVYNFTSTSVNLTYFTVVQKITGER